MRRRVSLWLLGFLPLWSVWIGGTAQPADARALVQSRAWEADIQLVQPLGDGSDGYLLAVDDRLILMDGPAGNWRLRETFIAPMDSFGGAALADVTGSGQPNLIIGGDGAGATYVYRRGRESWQLVARTPYLWSPVTSVQTAEVSAMGRHDVLVTDQEGRAYLFGWAFGEFELRWQSGEKVHAAYLADVTGDGRAEVIVWWPGGHVAVWQWAGDRLLEIWGNYPWGSIAGLTVGDVDGDGLADVVLNTSQGLLYAFGWHEGDFHLKRHLSHPELPFPHLAVGSPSLEGSTGIGLLASDGTRLFGFGLGTQGLVARWSSGPVGNIRGLLPVAHRSAFLVWHDGALRLLEPFPSDYIRVLWRGEPRPLRYPPRVEAGLLWLSARDVTDYLGWSLTWNAQTRRISGWGRGRFFIAEVDQTTVMTQRGLVELSAPVRLEQGRVYLPYDVFAAVGLLVSWNELSRELLVDEGRGE